MQRWISNCMNWIIMNISAASCLVPDTTLQQLSLKSPIQQPAVNNYSPALDYAPLGGSKGETLIHYERASYVIYISQAAESRLISQMPDDNVDSIKTFMKY